MIAIFKKTGSHTNYFNQQSAREEPIKNLIEANFKMMERHAIPMENQHNILKELIVENEDDE